MRSLVLSLVLMIVTSQVSLPVGENKSCQEMFVTFATSLTDDSSRNSNEKISWAIEYLPAVLQSCGLEQLADRFEMSSACVTDLGQVINLIQKIVTESSQAKVALGNFYLIEDIVMLARLYQTKIKRSCAFFNGVNINLKSSGVCLQSAYQLSLTVQTLWQHLIQGHAGAAFKDFETFLDDLPDTLDACGDHALANKIRKDFPAVCLRSFEDLAKELVVIEHNFDHLEWLVRHWKDLEKVLAQVKSTCPIFA